MKKLTPLQWLEYLANFVKLKILRNSLKCLHMIFVSVFFPSATILQYKQSKIEFYFFNESYNEEQGIGGFISWTRSFLTVWLKKKIVLSLVHFFFFLT